MPCLALLLLFLLTTQTGLTPPKVKHTKLQQ